MKRMPFCVCVAVAAVPNGGCLEAEDDVVQFAEDFEDGLDGWAVAGEAAIVTTNHPGEHAVWLSPGASITHPLQIDRMIDTDDNPYREGFTDGNWIEYSGDCRGRPALSLVPATDPPGMDVRVQLVIEGPPGTSDYFRSKLMFPALPPFIPAPDENDPYYQVDVRFTSLVVAASAPCHVDNLRVLVSGGTLGY